MPARPAPTGSVLHHVVHRYATTGDRLYGVVDAARDRELIFAARDQFDQKIRWLFKDNAGAHMGDVAPYVVPIEYSPRYPYRGSEYLDLWAERLGSSAGIMLLADADADALWVHLRGLFLVTDDEGHKYFFRFYDPRVLRVYLPTCTPAEAREFFGPIRQLLVEAEQPGKLLLCRPGQAGVEVREDMLDRSAESDSPGRVRR